MRCKSNKDLKGRMYGTYCASGISGCTDPEACNYDANAEDDGSCEYGNCGGCTDVYATTTLTQLTTTDLAITFRAAVAQMPQPVI